MRGIIRFTCEGASLFATLDAAAGATGLVIVSGGDEVRAGAHRGMALLAQRMAAVGVPVWRFDRRGIGDSEGENRGYASAAADIAAAIAAFRRAQPQLARVVAFGNCDAATALALLGDDADAVVLANPWLGDDAAALPPAALRAHYARRLSRPSGWLALARGGLRSRLKALAATVGEPREQPLASRFAAALGKRPTTIVLARGDRTAQVFAAAIRLPHGIPVERIDTASHSFAGHLDDLERILLAAVGRQDGTPVTCGA